MIDLLSDRDFKANLASQIVSCPDLANTAIAQLWGCLSEDIHEILSMDDCHVGLVMVDRVVYAAVVFHFVDANLLAEAENLDRLAKVLRVSYALTGLRAVASVYQGHGAIAQLDINDNGKYTLWSF